MFLKMIKNNLLLGIIGSLASAVLFFIYPNELFPERFAFLIFL